MIYLQLLPNAEFSYYGDDGCAFHLLNHKRFPCDKKTAELLEELLRGKPYEESEYEKDFKEYLSQLMIEGMLYQYQSPVYHEPYCSKSNMEIRGLFEEPPHMNQIYIQGAGTCNYNCKYCQLNPERTIVNYGCNSCIQWGDLSKSYTINDRTKDIKRLLQLHHSKITISGGNAFLDWKATRTVLKAILQADSSTKIHIIHNGSMLSEEILRFLSGQKIHMSIMVFGFDKDSYCKITGKRTSYEEFEELLKRFQELHITYELIPIGNGTNLKNIQEFVGNIHHMSVNNMVEISESKEKLRTSLTYQERKMLPLDEFFDRKRYNKCLYGKLALTMDGRIQPCPMIEDVLVDLKEQNLEYIFQNQQIDRYWRMTRKSITVCGHCPYQWICSDCTKTLAVVDQHGEKSGWICEHMRELGGDNYGAVASTIGNL